MATVRQIKKSDDFLSDFNDSFNVLNTHEDGSYYYTNAEGFTKDELMDEVTDEMNRLDSIGAVYQRADRIITGDRQRDGRYDYRTQRRELSRTCTRPILTTHRLCTRAIRLNKQYEARI